ncbi:MAG: amino acid permease, partial [Coriobacteriales bacterium]|nr:amino acid permease [Coriobacteriales bacterium]
PPDPANLLAGNFGFTNGPAGVFRAFQLAFLAYGGVELVGTTSGEAKDPEKTLPKAVNALPLRISLFYVVPLAIILIIAPWSSFVPGTSPFVQVFSLAGIGIAASVLNFVLFTAAASGTNSGIYAGSRMLYGLGESHEAPRFLERLSARAVPVPAVASLSIICILVAFVSLVVPNAADAYSLVASMVSPLFLIVWGMIVAAYIRYCVKDKAQHAASKFRAPGGMAMGVIVLAMFAFNYVLGLFYPDTLPGSLMAIGVIIIVQVAYYFVDKRRAKARD